MGSRDSLFWAMPVHVYSVYIYLYMCVHVYVCIQWKEGKGREGRKEGRREGYINIINLCCRKVVVSEMIM